MQDPLYSSDTLDCQLVRDSIGEVDKELEDLIGQPPDLPTAQSYRLEHAISDRVNGKAVPFPVCRTQSADLSEYSIGLELYLLLLKQLLWLFVIISLLSIGPLYSNTTGDFLGASKLFSLLNILSLANQAGPELRYYDEDISHELNKAKDQLSDVDRQYYFVSVSDALYTGLFLTFIIAFRLQASTRIRRHLKQHESLAHFAVKVSGLPMNDSTVRDVKEHFCQFGAVVEVYLGRKYFDVLFSFKEAAKINRALIEREKRLTGQGKVPERDSKFVKLRKKLQKVQQALRSEKNIRCHDELPVNAGFIIFSKKSERNNCLMAYQRWWSSRHRLLFKGLKRLKVEPAPEPSNILWENQDISRGSLCTRSFCSAMILLMVLLTSVAVVLIVKGIEEEMPSFEECFDYSEDFGVITSTQAKQLNDDKTLCWCREQDIDKLLDTSSEPHDICKKFLIDAARLTISRSMGAIAIVIIDVILKLIVLCLVKFERVKELTHQNKSNMIKMLLALFINSAIIVLVVNLDLPFLSYISSNLVHGYGDFTRSWYMNVGSVLTAMALAAMVSPHILVLLVVYPCCGLIRRCCWWRHANQYELNRAFLGAQFDIPERLAAVLALVYLCFMYSGGMPLLNIICLVGLLLIYWSDKCLLLRHYRKPPYYSPSLYLTSVNLLYLAVVLHSLLSLFMYSAPDIFSTGYHTHGKFLKADSISLQDRVWNRLGKVFLVYACVALLLFLLGTCRNSCMNRLFKRFKHKDEDVRFEDCVSQDLLKGLTSYKIKNNPEYAVLIAEMNRAARAPYAAS